MSEQSFPVIGLAGWSGSGKTTFGVKLVQELRARGLRIAIVKHTTHPSVMTDVQGSDTWHYAQVGAELVLLSTPQQLVSWRHWEEEQSLAKILDGLRGIDLALIEGYRSATMPRIEIWRREQGGAPITPQDQLLAWVSDGEARAGVPNFALDDVRGVADLLCQQFALPQRR